MLGIGVRGRVREDGGGESGDARRSLPDAPRPRQGAMSRTARQTRSVRRALVVISVSRYTWKTVVDDTQLAHIDQMLADGPLFSMV